MRQHPNIDALLRVARGQADEQEQAAVLMHCRSCSTCGDQLAVAIFLRAQPAVPAATPAAAPGAPGADGERSGRRRLLGAAGIAASLVVAFTAVAVAFRSPEPPPAAAEDAGAGVSEERARVLEAWAGFATDDNFHPRTYGFIKDVIYPERIRMADSDWLPLMRRAIADLEAGDYEASLVKLRELALDARVNLTDLAGWIGVARYLEGEDNEDVEVLLVRCTETQINILENMCRFTLGNLLFKRGRPEEGVVWIATVAAVPTRVGRQAKEFLERLPVDSLDPRLLRTVER